MFTIRGCWGGTGEAGTSRESVSAYIEKLHRAGINALFLGIKEGDGRLCWPSERFPEAVKPEYRDFDLPQVALEECHKRGMQLHGWLIDYYEGEHGAAHTAHPDWAALNAKGQATSEETLRGHRYSSVWMCPAQRPGYTDQWIVPIYRELAERYQLDSIHHDYIRYPGDLAPDQYCFCDYCLEAIPKFAGYVNEAYPKEPFFHDKYDRPYLEAHWEQSPRVLPTNWDSLPREFKSHFLLDGRYFSTGRSDLDYFFYLFRTHQINEFARLSYEAVRAVNDFTKLSGAIFKNPIQSGRFIGQDWRQFSQYMDIAVPMDYRDHFPGTFEQYLDLLAESVRNQKGWAAGMESLWIGVAINFLVHDAPREECGSRLRRVMDRLAEESVEGMVLFSSWQFEEFGVWDTIHEAWGR